MGQSDCRRLRLLSHYPPPGRLKPVKSTPFPPPERSSPKLIRAANVVAVSDELTTMSNFYGGAEDAAEGIPLTFAGVETSQQQAHKKRKSALGLVGLSVASAAVGAAAAVLYSQTAGVSSPISPTDTANLMDVDDDDPYLEYDSECTYNCGGDTLTWSVGRLSTPHRAAPRARIVHRIAPHRAALHLAANQ